MDKGFTLWFTGMSGAGKSTLTEALTPRLKAMGKRVEVLDGDEVRTNLSKGLGFSKEDRDTNIRRIGYVAQLLTRNGAVVITAAISPYRAIRDEIRGRIGDFVEVYAKCPLDALIARDVKGLYQKALTGEIKEFTGVSDPYEEPLNPEVVVNTDRETVEESANKILTRLQELGFLPHDGIGTIAPHGGRLVNRLVTGDQRAALLQKARALSQIRLDERAQSDVEMIAVGAFSPLRGFLGAADYRSVVENIRLANGLPWSIPVTLQVSRAQADTLKEGTEVALIDERNTILAVLELAERYVPNREEEARKVYGTTEAAHPGVAAVLGGGEVYLGGEIQVLNRPDTVAFPAYHRDPAQTRALFRERGWRTVVGFQTRNPIHRAHEYITKCALEIVDGLMLHPLVGKTKSDDIPADVRMRCYEILMEKYYPQDRVILSVYPAAMRYGGPREAIFHAIARKNYGCTHFIVGRDHAGVGSYYGTYDAQKIFDEFAPSELGIQPLKFENAFFSKVTGQMATAKTAPGGPETQVNLSGTKVREMLSKGELPPPEFSRPEVAKVLSGAMKK
ncbi:MAG TPA: sulfate adenylyltransferase [Candidatus Binatia bacterium]|jgi:sulfate adenylyltransferase/3'-phosphoadenosine 5'-phosphosulfate synthase|nr:sulfate adenylyltransferase [Candidatus Binatia bacterium]